MKRWPIVLIACSVAAGIAGAVAADAVRLPRDVQARQDDILNKPPRVAPLKPEEFGADATRVGNELRAALSLPPTDVVLDYTATMLKFPSLYQRHSQLAVEFFNGPLELRDRELAVLRTAWLCKAPYEWGEHVKIGKRLAKLTPEEIERVTHGSAAPGWSEHDRAVLRAVEELMKDAMISDATWAVLAKTFNDKQLLEFPLLIGQYQGVAYLQNSIRAGMGEGNPGLTAR